MAKEIRKIRDALESQLKKTDETIASAEAIAECVSKVNNTIKSGFTEIRTGLEYGFTKLSAGLQDLCFAVEEGFGEVVYMLELQGKTLEAIREILERPLDTQAKELRRRAEVAYLNGWFDEAETDLLEAEKKNYQDFIVHQILGNIYYYHKCNYQKALEYYQKAAKYSCPRSKKHASDALICIAMVYCRLGQLSDAYESTKKALELTPHDPHVLFNHVRYGAKIGYTDKSLDGLKECTYKDPNYLMIADTDGFFFAVKRKIKKLAEELRSERKTIVNNIIGVINSAIKEAGAIGIHKFSMSVDQFRERLAEVNKLCARNSYLDFVKAEQIARNIVSELIPIKKTLLDRLKTEAERKAEGKGDFILWGIYISAAILTSLFLLVVAKAKVFGPPESLLEYIILLIIGIPILAVALPLFAIFSLLVAISESLSISFRTPSISISGFNAFFRYSFAYYFAFVKNYGSKDSTQGYKKQYGKSNRCY